MFFSKGQIVPLLLKLVVLLLTAYQNHTEMKGKNSPKRDSLLRNTKGMSECIKMICILLIEILRFLKEILDVMHLREFQLYTS